MTDTDPNDQWMTVDQVCAWLQVRKSWLYDEVEKKKIPHRKLGRQLRFYRPALDKWLEEQT